MARLWSLPGGHIEPGETARMAALREVTEETGVSARIDGLVHVQDAINAPDGIIASHHVIVFHQGQWLSGNQGSCDTGIHTAGVLSNASRFASMNWLSVLLAPWILFVIANLSAGFMPSRNSRLKSRSLLRN